MQTAALIAALRTEGFDAVTPALAAAMPLIADEGSRPSDMARQAGLTKRAIGQLVGELTGRGYVELRRDLADVRATLVWLTPRSLELRRRGFEIKPALQRDAEALVGREHLADLETALKVLLGLEHYERS